MQKKIFVISGPSGVGKTTLYKDCLKRHENIFGFSVSATTRPIRKGEVHGVDYYFISKEEFDKLVAENAFLEWENNYGNCYGTLKTEIDRIWKSGRHCFLDLDVKGALNIRDLFPNDSILIFIEPPSLEVLSQRLCSRGEEKNMDFRLQQAQEEISQKHAYDHVIINKDVDVAANELDMVIKVHADGDMRRA
ncbi:MAG: guanylate kinase [Brevinema sp.]